RAKRPSRSCARIPTKRSRSASSARRVSSSAASCSGATTASKPRSHGRRESVRDPAQSAIAGFASRRPKCGCLGRSRAIGYGLRSMIGPTVRTIVPPPARLLLGELRGAVEPARLLLRAPLLATLPRGRGAHVVVLPGYGASESSTAVLQGFLRLLGYRSFHWGLGRNTGNVARFVPRVLERAEEVAGDAEVHLVGWSLGGYIAREAARERPGRFRSVVTLGSPVVGGPKYTTVARRYQ